MSNFFHIRCCETDKILHHFADDKWFYNEYEKADDIWFYLIFYLNLLLK